MFVYLSVITGWTIAGWGLLGGCVLACAWLTVRRLRRGREPS